MTFLFFAVYCSLIPKTHTETPTQNIFFELAAMKEIPQLTESLEDYLEAIAELIAVEVPGLPAYRIIRPE